MAKEEARLCGSIDEPPFSPTEEAMDMFGWAAGINKKDGWKEGVVARNRDFDATKGDFRDRGTPKPRVLHFPCSPVDQADEMARSRWKDRGNENRLQNNEVSKKGSPWMGPV
jgi:hypothetical protein